MTSKDCLGCRTAAGEFAADEVYRDDRVVAVVAHRAVNPGHLVVVTREHVRNALAMGDAELAHLMRVGRDLARGLLAVLPSPGVMLVLNNEPPCQTLFHTHLHVIPRTPGDAMDHSFGCDVGPEERAQMAARLRPALATVLIGADPGRRHHGGSAS